MPTTFRVLLVCLLGLSVNVDAESTVGTGSLFDFDASTPKGSWVEHEITTTDSQRPQEYLDPQTRNVLKPSSVKGRTITGWKMKWIITSSRKASANARVSTW